MTNPYPFLQCLSLGGSALKLTEHAVRSISQTLSMVERGSVGNVLRTPFMKDHDQEDIISRVDKVFYDRLSSLEKGLTELELSARSKIGPRSQALPWSKRKGSVERYFTYPWPEIDTRGLNRIRSAGSLRPITPYHASMYLLNNTSSGLPFMKKKGLIRDEAVRTFDRLWSKKDKTDLRKILSYPSMLFTRTQESLKTRTVWGISIYDILNEQMFYRPLLGLMSRVGWRAALRGPDDVNSGITRLIMNSAKTKSQLVSIDFSSYDQSVSPDLSLFAFGSIAELFQPESRPHIMELGKRFITVPLITPEGVWGCPDPLKPELDQHVLRKHGVPSGSSFTNEVDSLVQFSIATGSGALESAELCQIQGDDGAYSVSDPARLIEHFRAFGLDVNLTKSYTNDSFLVYLQNYFSGGYVRKGVTVGIYPIYRALGRLIYLESYTDFEKLGLSGEDYFAIRAISILENCKWHPFFREFVEFVANHDRENLKFTDSGLKAYVKASLAKGRQEVKNQYGEFISGLRSFETYKILMRL